MKRDSLTYAAVAEVCEQLIKAGEKPNQRKIQQRLGGSFSTILGFLTQWKTQHDFALQVDTDLSDPFRQAVLAEIGRAVTQAKTRLESQLAEAGEQLQEAQGVLAEYEEKLNTAEQKIQALEERYHQYELRYTADLSAAQTRIEEGEKREAQQHQALSELREQKHEADIRATRAETQTEALKEQLGVLTKK